jgi:hypothetical protein
MHLRILLAVGSLSLVAAQSGQGPTDAPAHQAALIGTWQLDLGRTHYGPGVDRRRRERMRCDVRERSLQCAVESVRADGREVTAGFTAPVTGVAAPVGGLADVDTVRLQTRQGGIVDATFSYRGRPTFGYRAYRSDDNATLVIVSVDPRTRVALTSVVVYGRAGTAGHTMSPNER